ncbi:penicillin amidase [Fodinibius salinus]|uniref:Penicillin amidase n=1 Tax=Fodinibius salinus TaxID=860790 RepID=A0A5D3YMB5_9BACT|nr:penicillin acylase family protein [Fodinibius salinus]TYP94902.1 penicillin amidase [Fodinibius salinus]
MKSISRGLLFIGILVLGIAILGIYWTFYRPLPDYNATTTQPQLQQKVNIHWDSRGVPHIYAESKHDLYYSLGYVHAQDRLWQMTLSQMAIEGRFAEFLGKKMVPYDKLQRTIGFWRTAKKIEKTLSDSTRRQLQAYTDGVNSYIQKNPKSLPIQFSLTGMEPIQWTITHSIALTRLMAWDLNLAWKSELTYAYLSEQLSRNKFSDLLPDTNFVAGHSVPSHSDRWAQSLMPIIQKDEQLNKMLGKQGSHLGSNAWAVSGQKSADSAPLLAGDPHLGINIPGKWYEAHLNLNGRNLSGATLAGAPIVVLGQNEQLGWSLTNVMLDDTDFYQEAVDPQNKNRYAVDSLDGNAIYEKFEYQQEVLKIKNADDTVFTRKVTNHGPVISDIFTEQNYIDNRVITMRWTGHEVSHEIEALLGMNWATSFSEFRQEASKFKAPAQNVVYADTAGNIARLTLGKVPKRSGNPILLRDGWDSSQNWQETVPFDELPSTVNPDRGWVANANNPVGGQNYEHYLSIYWEPDARYERIKQYLKRDIPFSPTTFQEMQNDSYSLYARDLTKLILPVLKKSKADSFDTVISYLENWDYSYDPSETAASIMDVFMLKLSKNIFEDDLGPAVYNNFVQFSALPERTLMRALRNQNSFIENKQTENKIEDHADLIIQSMQETTTFLTQRLGSEPFEWRWGQLHTISLKPPLLGRAAEKEDASETLQLVVNNLLSKGPYPTEGHGLSINNGEYNWNDPYQMILGPSIRRVVDFSDLSRTRSIMPTGQSGNPLSQFYGDQTESWLNGQYKFVYQDSSFFNEIPYQTTTLLPEE